MATPSSLTALADLAGALLPLRARDLQTQIDERLAKIPNQINRYGYDAYGMSPRWIRRALLPAALLYRHYFRVETFGIERLPRGRVLVISNHAGQLPFDGAMLATALLLEASPPRIARSMGEFWIPRLPWISVAAARAGALVGTPRNCRHMLENDECVVAFPEGVRGMNKVFSQRYQLQRFGTGFMRLALESGAPIVPVAIVGSEEQQPGIANLAGLGRSLGMPPVPITLTFPWLGPLGLLPLPVKYRIHFGEPMLFDGDPSDEDATIESKVE
ncbi:MAG: lysophospholipid acyltransferase family protein, partial [Myxococcota bacterium]